MEQIVDMIDGHDVLCQDCYLIIKIYLFAGQSKFRGDVLLVRRIGGKERVLHDAVVFEGCVEVGEAKMQKNGV